MQQGSPGERPDLRDPALRRNVFGQRMGTIEAVLRHAAGTPDAMVCLS